MSSKGTRSIGASAPEGRRRRSRKRDSDAEPVQKFPTDTGVAEAAPPADLDMDRKAGASGPDHELAQRLGCPVEALARKRSSSTSALYSGGDARRAAARRVQSLVDSIDEEDDDGRAGSKFCTAHCELALARNFPVIQAVLTIAQSIGEIELGVHCSTVAIGVGQPVLDADRTYKWVARKAIKEINTSHLLFREETIFTKYISNSLFIEGRPYLVAVLRKTLKHVLVKKVQCEIDPAKEPDADQRSLNELNIVQAVRNLIEACTGAASKVTLNMRRIFGAIFDATAAQFDEETAYQAVGAVFFLRFVCPNIVLPHTLGIVKEVDSAARRKLILLTKFVQLIANNTTSTDQEWVDRVLERVYTAKCQKKLRKFFEKIKSGGKKGKCYYDSLTTVDRVINHSGELVTSFMVASAEELQPELIQRCLHQWDVMSTSERDYANKTHAAQEKKREKEKAEVKQAWPASMLAVDEFENAISTATACGRGCKPQAYRKYHAAGTSKRAAMVSPVADSLCRPARAGMPLPQSTEEKIAHVKSLKEAGNACFSAGDYAGAVKQYQYASLYLRSLLVKSAGLAALAGEAQDELSPADRFEAEQVAISVYNNLAATHLALERYAAAVQDCTKVLELDPDNSKAHYRQGSAYLRMGVLDKARAGLTTALRSFPTSKALRSELNTLKQREREQLAAERAAYGRMFS